MLSETETCPPTGFRRLMKIRSVRLKKALKITATVLSGAVALISLLILFKYGATAPSTTIMEPATGSPPTTGKSPGTSRGDVSLPDLVYFGAAWQILNKHVGEAPIGLGAQYGNARIERTSDGLFFAGIVDRFGTNGTVSDVVLAFAGAQAAGDFIQGESLAHGRVLGEPKWAATVFERVWSDPRYANARIYVTGHSLGAGYAQFVGTEAIARHGLQAVRSRVKIVAFGVPNWGPQAARYFGVGPHVLDSVFTGYTASNDPVITNGGTERVGITHVLPAFTGLTGFSSHFNAIAAHWPTTYMTALGLPDWLTKEQKRRAIEKVSAMFITGNSYDPNYGRSKAAR
jgi:hypothetical protein